MNNLPGNNVFEFSLIGTGGGYGESIVIHLGNQNWVVVDSCVDPKTKSCLPLEYLQAKGVNLSSDVKLIICTHWHDDHILGISDLLNASPSATFSMTRCTDTKKFLQFVGLDYNKSISEASASSTVEIKKCFDILKNRKSPIKGAEQDKLLWQNDLNNITSRIYSLSPSDYVVNEFDKEISTLITEYGSSNKKVVIQAPNDKSVALFVSVNNHNIILGSDLEVSNTNNKGWLCILDNCQCIDSKSSLFKIPHHGSNTGYNTRIWNELLIENVTANLTPWNVGQKLPRKDMLKIFLNHTDKLYVTSLNNYSDNAKKRERSISKAISKFNNTLCEVRYKFGIVRCRLNILIQDSVWETNLFGEALKVTNEITEKQPCA